MNGLNGLKVLWNRKYTDFYFFTLMICLLLGFNWYFIFGVKGLILDDQEFYTEALQNTFPFWPESTRSIWTPFSSFLLQIPFFELLRVDIVLARLAVFLFLSAPASILFYMLLSRVFHLNRVVSFFAAVLPNLLPKELFLITFVNGSYSITSFVLIELSLLFYYLTFIRRFSWKYWVSSGFLYYLAIITSEQAVFFLPVIVLFHIYLLKFEQIDKPKLWALSIYATIGLAKLVYTMLTPRVTHGTTDFSIELVKKRLLDCIIVSNPLVGVLESVNIRILFLYILLFVSLVMGLYFFIRWMQKEVSSQRPYYILAFFTVWFVTNSIPFLFFARFNPTRYYYIASYGMIVILILGIYYLFRVLTTPIARFSKTVIIALLSLLLLASGGIRVKNAKAFYNHSNKAFNKIKNNILPAQIKENGQIIVLGHIAETTTGGYYTWSTGYLQFALNRNDISGIMHTEYNFYDPFYKFYDPFYKEEKKYSLFMSGLEITKPTYIYYFDPDGTVRTISYFLRWFGYTETNFQRKIITLNEIKLLKELHKDNKWELYTFDPATDLPTLISHGVGKEAYFKKLESLGLQPHEVAFGKAE